MRKPRRRLGVAPLVTLAVWAAAGLPGGAAAQGTPTGWLGIHYSAEAKIDQTGEGLTISYNSYPVVEALEPGSPAERAGLQVGDTLLAFNGHDFVGRGVPMTRLLRPGEKVSIRLKRNDRRTINVTVGERPPGVFVMRMRTTDPGARTMIHRSPRAGMTEMQRSAAELREASTVLAPRAVALAEDVARRTVRALEREIVMNPSVSPLIAFGTPSGAMLIAGAEMVPVNPELGDVLGVRKGVLLVNVPAATPADRAGLRAGDVVVRVASSEITDPAGLHMAMIQAGPARTLQMDIVRKGRAQRVVLRW